MRIVVISLLAATSVAFATRAADAQGVPPSAHDVCEYGWDELRPAMTRVASACGAAKNAEERALERARTNAEKETAGLTTRLDEQKKALRKAKRRLKKARKSGRPTAEHQDEVQRLTDVVARMKAAIAQQREQHVQRFLSIDSTLRMERTRLIKRICDAAANEPGLHLKCIDRFGQWMR